MPFTTTGLVMTLPYVNSASADPGPQYAVLINNAFVSGVAAHNHVPPLGIYQPRVRSPSLTVSC
jgi:hypothetical protein